MTLAALWALASYLRIRSFGVFIRDRRALRRWQSKRLARWVGRDLPRVAAFKSRPRLEDLPIMDKADLMADFSRYNLPVFTNAQGWAAFEGSRQIGGYTIGASTGTSGNRGLFVISEREKFAWLGAILAKAVPDFWRHRDRVAVLLPLDTPLYDSANQATRLKLAFFDINRPLESHAAALRAFAPTLLIAAPRILCQMLALGIDVAPRRVFSASEKLDEIDRRVIEAGFKVPLGEIYMATEGLLGVSCAHHRLHLAEDCLHFEFAPVGGGLVSPIITDFSRRTQIIARYRMNDLLTLDRSPCPCGSPLMVVKEVVGRQDDVFSLPSASGGRVELTPDILRNAILDTDRAISDFRLVQTGSDVVELHLPAALLPKTGEAVRARLLALFQQHHVANGCRIDVAEIAPVQAGKLRRIKRLWHAPQASTAADQSRKDKALGFLA